MNAKRIARILFSLMIMVMLFWLLSIQSQAASAPMAVYLPMVMNRYPAVPDAPVLNPIDNPGGGENYTVSWNAASLASSYVLEEDDAPAFSSPSSVYSGSSRSWAAAGKAPGSYYYRVKAHNSQGDSRWSNLQSTTVSAPLTLLSVENATGCSLCYEVVGTGIGQKCYSSNGTYYYGSFPAGTYTWKVTTACCGSGSGSRNFEEGEYNHRFWCAPARPLGENPSGLQCELR